jgi:4-amino-4-deoxy-L-arabinose transferase-like glycosyltransferase
MMQRQTRFQPAEALRAASRGELPVWLRVVLLTGALALGALAYHHHMSPLTVWGRWLAELVAGCALLTLALRENAAPAEAGLRRWARRSMWVVLLVALAAAFRLVPQPGREGAAAVAVLGAVLAFFLARWLPFAPEDVRALTGGLGASGAHPVAGARWRIAVVCAGVGVAGAAAFLNAGHHVAGFVLWLASLGLFAAGMPRRAVVDPDAGHGWIAESGPPLSRRAEALLLALTLVLALVLRVSFLHEVPAAVNSDEGRLGRYAERIWQPGFPDAFDIGWNVFPHLAFMVQYASVQVLGTSNANLRVGSAVVGVLCVVPLFFWARRWWGNVIAVLAVAILAINGEHIWWSRVALNNIQAVLVAVLMLAAFARVLATRRWQDWVWLGYASGLAFHTYHAAKLFPVLLAGAGVLFAVGIRGFTRRYLTGAVVGAVAFVLCLGPLLVTIYRRWDFFYLGQSNRVDLRYLVEAYQRSDISGVRNYVSSHVLGCALSFISTPSPLFATFDPFMAVPFLLGIGWMLWRWRDPRHLVVLVWTLGILVIGGMITDYPPNIPRMIGFLPAVCLIPAVVIGRARALLCRWSPLRGDLIAVPLMLLWLGAALHHNIQTQFFDIPRIQRGDVMTELCRAIDRAPLPATMYMAGGGVMSEPKVAANDCMIAPNPDRTLINLPDDAAIVPIPPTNRGNAVLLIDVHQRELLPLIRHYYSGVDTDVVTNGVGVPVLYIVTVTSDTIERSRGLRATYRSASRTWSPAAASFTFAAPPDSEFPVNAAWRGEIWIPQPGRYAFRALGGTLDIDSKPLPEEGSRTLAAGWHLIELRATFTQKASGITLQWRPPGATEWVAIPRTHLHAHPELHGLLGRYFRGVIAEPPNPAEPISVAPDYTHLDTVLSFDWYTELDDRPPEAYAARPGVMEWVGTVDVPEGSSHTLRLEATGPTRVFINGKLVLSAQGRVEGERVQGDLSGVSGRVPILVRSVRPADAEFRIWKLRLLWGEPGGGWTAFVPYHPAEVDDQWHVVGIP